MKKRRKKKKMRRRRTLPLAPWSRPLLLSSSLQFTKTKDLHLLQFLLRKVLLKRTKRRMKIKERKRMKIVEGSKIAAEKKQEGGEAKVNSKW